MAHADPSSQSGPASKSQASPGSALKTSSTGRHLPATPSSSSSPKQNNVSPSQSGATPPPQFSSSCAGATQRSVSSEQSSPSSHWSSPEQLSPALSLAAQVPGQLSENLQMLTPSHSMSVV